MEEGARSELKVFGMPSEKIPFNRAVYVQEICSSLFFFIFYVLVMYTYDIERKIDFGDVKHSLRQGTAQTSTLFRLALRFVFTADFHSALLAPSVRNFCLPVYLAPKYRVRLHIHH